jgi:hypothetical protein
MGYWFQLTDPMAELVSSRLSHAIKMKPPEGTLLTVIDLVTKLVVVFVTAPDAVTYPDVWL